MNVFEKWFTYGKNFQVLKLICNSICGGFFIQICPLERIITSSEKIEGSTPWILNIILGSIKLPHLVLVLHVLKTHFDLTIALFILIILRSNNVRFSITVINLNDGITIWMGLNSILILTLKKLCEFFLKRRKASIEIGKCVYLQVKEREIEP